MGGRGRTAGAEIGGRRVHYLWTTVATVLASLGHLIGFDVGLVWSLIVASAVGLTSVYYRVKPGLQPMERVSWGQLAVIIIGGLVLGLLLRWFAFGTVNLLFQLLPA